jgi:multidrug efflux pump subunit AcrB
VCRYSGIKNGNASTLGVVNAVKQAMVTARAAAPPGMQVKELFDQSIFVRDSIRGLLKEGAIAAGLTALMIVLFLGSWRSTLVVMISIPLSILSSLVVLYFLGDTINTMTLGGLALAIGILVDDSTVTIENTHSSARPRVRSGILPSPRRAGRGSWRTAALPPGRYRRAERGEKVLCRAVQEYDGDEHATDG